jgi:hypothetical protein
VEIARINSSGTVQGSTFTSAEQSLGTTGVKTFTFTSANLGTWTTGDRLRVSYIFRNTAKTPQTVTIGTGTTNEEVITPFGAPPRTRSFGFFMD